MSGADGWIRAIRSIAEAYADTPRPWTRVLCLDTSEYSASGPCHVQVLWGGASRRCALSTPSAKPVAGATYLQVKLADAGATAPLVALPLPLVLTTPPAVNPSCLDGVWYVSARSTGGDWAILNLDASAAARGTVGGAPGPPRWSHVSASPTGGDARPLFWVVIGTPEHAYPYHGFADGQTTAGFTGRRLRFFTHDAAGGGGLYYSDDRCATWTSAGIAPVYVARTGYFGAMLACAAGALYRSRDWGATWTAIPGAGPPAGAWRFVASPGASTVVRDDGGSATDFYASGVDAGRLRAGNTAKHGYLAAVADAGVWYSINEFAHFAFPPDYADPAFSGEDPNDRAWQDDGADDGAFTCDATLFGICTHRTFPWVTSKVYRDRYGPYGAAVPAGERAFFSGHNWLPTLRASQSQEGPLVVPGKGALPAATAPYDETALKDQGYDSSLPGSDAAHFNAAGVERGPHLICQTGAGGIVWRYAASAVAYWGSHHHPYELATAVLDGCDHRDPTDGGICYLVGLDDATQGAGRCSFALASYAGLSFQPGPDGRSYRTNGLRFEDASVAMIADTGAYWLASREGIATYQPDTLPSDG